MDRNSQIIAELRAEITELKRKVSSLEDKFNHNEEITELKRRVSALENKLNHKVELQIQDITEHAHTVNVNSHGLTV